MKKKRSNKKAIIAVVIALVVAAVLVFSLLQGQAEKPAEVTFAQVERRTIVQTVSATGTIQPETKVKISSEISGEIVNLAVKEGDDIAKNMLLVKINPAILETQLEQYRAMLNASRSDESSIKVQLENLLTELKRAQDLHAKNFVSKQELDKAQSTYDATLSNYNAAVARSKSAEASLKQIQTEAHKTNIFSPIDGIVTSLLVEKGERVVGTNMMSGTELMTISDLSVMNAEVDVDENDIIMVKLGDTAEIEIDAVPDRIFKGVVVELGHSAKLSTTTSQTTTFNVKIKLLDSDASKLRPGMSCNVEIHTAKHENVLAIPLQAVTSRDASINPEATGDESNTMVEVVTDEEDNKPKQITRKPKTIVFIKNGNKAKQREVEIGISDMGYVEILAGLKEKETIISGNYQAVSQLLSDGMPIKEKGNLEGVPNSPPPKP